MLNRNSVLVKVIGLVLLVAVVPLSFVFAQDDAMSVEDTNKELVTRYFEEFFVTGDTDVFAELVSPDVVNYELEAMDGLSDFETWSMSIAMLNDAASDLTVEIIDVIAEDDKVVVYAVMTGTHDGELMGIPATGNDVYVPFFDLFRLEDGLIVEHWAVNDTAAFFTQFGLIPMPEMQ